MPTKDAIQESYLAILAYELVPALGCTEPIAISYACAKAREILGCLPDHMEIACSGNIVKNVKGVIVPHSGNLKGIEVAAILGVVGGDANRALQVLESVTAEHQTQLRQLLAQPGYCACRLLRGEENLAIVATVWANADEVQVEIRSSHTNITRIEKNGKVLLLQNTDPGNYPAMPDKSLLNVQDILEFIGRVNVELLIPIIRTQIQANVAISQEGLTHPYGAAVGKTLLELGQDDIRVRARAAAAAGSDARMSGCDLPVVINSGSGNQGVAVSLPVIEYAKALDVGEETLYRALALSNLVAIHQKRYIGPLSAYCGAVSAACGSGAAITYLHGGDYEAVCRTITNTLANVGGIVCDGAKPSCAAKIASAVEAAVTAHELSMRGRVFASGEGLVGGDVEQTIRNFGRMACDGMCSTDEEILTIMLEENSHNCSSFPT